MILLTGGTGKISCRIAPLLFSVAAMFSWRLDPASYRPSIQALTLKRDKTRGIPLSLIPFIYKNTPPRSPLRRLWSGWVVQFATPEIFENND